MPLPGLIPLGALCAHTVTVKTLQIVTDANGFRHKTWVVRYPAVPALVQPARSDIVTRFARNGIEVSHTVYIGGTGGGGVAGLDIDQSEQLVFGSRVFQIVGSENWDEQNLYLRLHCMERKP